MATKTTHTKASIRSWMRRNLEAYRNRQTGEVNMTTLVEGWDSECADGAETMDSNHPAWDVAVELAAPSRSSLERLKIGR